MTREQEDERTRGQGNSSRPTSYFLLPTSYLNIITFFHKRQTFEQVSSLRNLSKFYLIL